MIMSLKNGNQNLPYFCLKIFEGPINERVRVPQAPYSMTPYLFIYFFIPNHAEAKNSHPVGVINCWASRTEAQRALILRPRRATRPWLCSAVNASTTAL